MKKFLLIAFLLVLSLNRKLNVIDDIEQPEEKEEKEPRKTPYYDMYVFSVQWGMSVCQEDKSAICYQKLAMIPKNHMSIHGLWPSLSSGVQLPTCNQGPQIPIYDDGSELKYWMKSYWPSLKGADATFWTHEYNTHGYCYSELIEDYDPDYYFMKVREQFLFKGLNTLIIDTFGEEYSTLELSYNELVARLSATLGGKFFMPVCSGSRLERTQRLTELRFNLDLDFNFLPNYKADSCSKTKPITLTFRP